MNHFNTNDNDKSISIEDSFAKQRFNPDFKYGQYACNDKPNLNGN